ncbi:hypothetical protein AWB66_01500 [Caballeronia telluris]|uniref:Uncharacterized protein n=2 Tax=Caballeronia telluris TaxID=326475 RepID=A0A158G2W7_9BURK|nr:hypothetical protein AWB66_01500 [Caballeronia telluris]
MPANRKTRKPYIARSKRKDITSFLFEGNAPLDNSTRTAILTAVHAAALSISRGENVKSAWHTVVNALNIAQILCEEAGNGKVGLEVVYAAQNAMIDAAERFHATGRLVFGAGGLPAMNSGIDLFEQLIETVTKLQYTRAAGESVRRNESGKVVMVRNSGGTKRFELRAA